MSIYNAISSLVYHFIPLDFIVLDFLVLDLIILDFLNL
jgi:hypothetical protein